MQKGNSSCLVNLQSVFSFPIGVQYQMWIQSVCKAYYKQIIQDKLVYKYIHSNIKISSKRRKVKFH